MFRLYGLAGSVGEHYTRLRTIQPHVVRVIGSVHHDGQVFLRRPAITVTNPDTLPTHVVSHSLSSLTDRGTHA
jgi:hypothetical protein